MPGDKRKVDPRYELGGYVRKLREARGLSQADLAHRAELDVSSISKLERGTYRSPRVRTIMAIARALRINESEFTHLWELANSARGEALAGESGADRAQDTLASYALGPTFESVDRRYRPDVVVQDEEGQLHALELKHRSLTQEAVALREQAIRAQELAYERAMESNAVRQEITRLMDARRTREGRQVQRQALEQEIQIREIELEQLRRELRELVSTDVESEHETNVRRGTHPFIPGPRLLEIDVPPDDPS